MDVTALSPYLAGIQKVPGNTKSDKLNTLNRIAKKIIETTNNNESLESAIDKTDVPEVMKPLIRVEIARLLRQSEEIVEALKSDDSVVVDRALRAKWFFNGNEDSVKLYRELIWPFVSLQSRAKIIKTLANNLIESVVAEEFYSELSSMYGEKQAHPLLIACSELFIWRCISEHKIQLNNRIIKLLFYKYPELIIKYIKFCRKNPDFHMGNVPFIDMEFLTYFLPRLIKKFPTAFVEIIKLYGYHYIHLSNTRTELFLKNCINALMTDTNLFLPMLDLKTVSRKLTEDQFKIVFKQMFPKIIGLAQVFNLWPYLKFLPEEKKVSLMLSSFEEVYKVSLFNHPKKILPDFMRLLPCEARINQARIKLKKPGSKCSRDLERQWICYLPIEESIPTIMTDIEKASDEEERCLSLQKLIYTCFVNFDGEQLLQMLKYISMAHKNERPLNLLSVLDILVWKDNVKMVNRDHWEVVYGILKFLLVENKFSAQYHMAERIFRTAVRFDYMNNSTTDQISFLADLLLNGCNYLLNFFEDNILLERKFLEELITYLPWKKLNENNYYSVINLIKAITNAMDTFNDRNLKANSPLEMMLIKNYPWVADEVKKILEKYADDKNYHANCIKRIVEKQIKNLESNLVPEEEELINLQDPKALKILSNNPEKFSQNWELYLKSIYCHHDKKSVRRFITSARWYQDLPIKFAEKCLEDLYNKNGRGLIILALLVEGPALEKVIASFLPMSAEINPNYKEAKDDSNLEKFIVNAFNVVNPPVSLDFIINFSKSDHIHTIVNCLFNVTRRTSATKVIYFAEKLTDQPISMKKHSLRLYCMVADGQKLRDVLVNIWRTETHQTIRTLVFKNMFKVFRTKPNDETWQLFKECIDGLKADDDKDVFKEIMKLEAIPNEYISEYVRKLFKVFHELAKSDPEVWSYIRMLLDVDKEIATLYSEEIHQEIIENFVLDFTLPKDRLTVGFNYLVNIYIVYAGDKLKERLERFREIVKIVTDNWNIPQPNDPSFYPANYFIHNTISNVTLNFSPNSLKTKLINVLFDAFNTVLKPWQDPESYLRLLLNSRIQNPIPARELALKVKELLPKLIEIFSTTLMSLTASCLLRHVKSFAMCRSDKYQLDMIQSLIKLHNYETTIFAAHILLLLEPRSEKEWYLEIIKDFKQYYHPSVIKRINYATL